MIDINKVLNILAVIIFALIIVIACCIYLISIKITVVEVTPVVNECKATEKSVPTAVSNYRVKPVVIATPQVVQKPSKPKPKPIDSFLQEKAVK